MSNGPTQKPNEPGARDHGESLLGWLLLLQLAAVFSLSIVVAPGAWINSVSEPLSQVFLALALGAIISLPALVMASRILQRRLEQRARPANLPAATISSEERVTRLEVAYRRLESAGAFLGEVYRSVPGLLFVLDSGNRVVLVNDGARELLGFTEDDMIGQPLWSFFDAAEDLEYARMQAQCEGGLLPATRRKARRSDGGHIDVLLSARLSTSSTGDHSFVCVAFQLPASAEIWGVDRTGLETAPSLVGGDQERSADAVRTWPHAGYTRSRAA